MGEVTGIAWCDATFNPWIGCTKVGPGCDHCYAEASNQRFAAGANWGSGAARRRTAPANWRKPVLWNESRALGFEKMGRGDRKYPTPLWVFCASQADVFDNEVDPKWRADLWRLIRETPHLRWQLVTKRIGNVGKMLPADWRGGVGYEHVGIIATIVNQEEWLRDGPKLLALKQIGVRWVGISYEPALGPLDLSAVSGWEALDWVICGGESIQRGKVRDFHLSWARVLLGQCRPTGIPFFMKQTGSRVVAGAIPYRPADRAGADPAEWPEDLRVRQMPRTYARGDQPANPGEGR